MTTLFPILRKASAGKPPRDFKEVRVDSDGAVVKPGFASLFKATQGWWVLPNMPLRLDRSTVELTDGEESVVVDVVHTVTLGDPACYVEGFGRLVRDGDPYLAIADGYKKRVREWLRRDIEEHPGLHVLERLVRNEEELEAGTPGRDVTVRTKVNFDRTEIDFSSNPLVLRPRHVILPSFSIHLTNMARSQVKIALDVSLKRFGSYSIQPPSERPDWERLVEQVVVKGAKQSIKVQDYYGDKVALAQTVGRLIDQDIRRLGRKVDTIQVTALTSLELPEKQTLNIDLPWKGTPSGCEIKFNVSATVEVRPEKNEPLDEADPGGKADFLASGISTDLPHWTRERIMAIIASELVGLDFVHLDPERCAQLQDSLSRRLQDAARPNGLVIAPVIARPNLPEVVTKRTVSVSTGSKEPYQTKTGGFPVILDITIAGKFTRLDEVTSLLHKDGKILPPEEGLHRRIIDVVREAAQAVIRNATIERYVEKFEGVPEQVPPPLEPAVSDRSGGGQPGGRIIDQAGNVDEVPSQPTQLLANPDASAPGLADLIKARIEHELRSRLHLECSLEDIQLVQRNDRGTELSQFIYNLRTFQVRGPVIPAQLAGRTNEHVVEIEFRVTTVNSRDLIVAIRPDYDEKLLQDEIKKQIEIWTFEHLRRIRKDILVNPNNDALKEALNQYIVRASSRFFGAEIEALSIIVQPSYADTVKIGQDELLLQAQGQDLDYAAARNKNPIHRQAFLAGRADPASAAPKELPPPDNDL